MKVPGRVSCCNALVIGFALLFSQSVFAWGELGHGAVGFIAEKNLTSNAQKMVQNIIGLESLAIAANWPDLIRSDDRFKDFAPYHYIEETADKDARTIIEQAPKRILDKKASREEKMIWLRYIIHVVGDLHQPLHVGNGVDRGGNMCEVKYEGHLTNLHTFWDEGIINSIRKDYEQKNPPPPGKKRWFDYVNLTEILLKDSDETMKTANAVKPDGWYAEARTYHTQIYPDAKPVLDPKDRTYCHSGAHKADQVPTLDEAYVKKNLPLAKKQLVKGGYRLAQFLNELGDKYAKAFPKMTKILNPNDFIIKNKK